MYEIRHVPVTTRTTEIHTFSWVCWGLGTLAGFGLLYATGQLLSLLIVVAAGLIGMPIKDRGVPHQWALRELRHRTRLRSGANDDAAPLTRSNKVPSRWDRIETTYAAIREPDGSISELPLRGTKKRTHLTCYLLLEQASPSWLESDDPEQLDWDAKFQRVLGKALSATREPDLWIGHTVWRRPADPTVHFRYNGSRMERHALEGAYLGHADEALGIDEVDVVIGQNIIEQTDTVGEDEGVLTNIAAIRMPWPRGRNGRKIDPTDPKAFSRSKLRRTMQSVVGAYEQCGIAVRFPTTHELNVVYSTAVNLTQLNDRRLGYENDRELVRHGAAVGHIDDTPGAGESSWKPYSTRPPRGDKAPGWVVCDGTYIAAGYGDEINVPSLASSFQVGLGGDTYFGAATLVHARLTSGEANRARERERFSGIMEDLTGSLNARLSNPEFEREHAKILAHRENLAHSGRRAGAYQHLFTVVASSVEELEARWEDFVVQMSEVYEIHRVMWSDEILDIVEAQLGIFDKK